MYTSLAQSIASSWLGISLHDTLNPTVDEGRLERVTVELDRSWSFVRFPIGPQQRATLRLEKGIGVPLQEQPITCVEKLTFFCAYRRFTSGD